MTPELQQAFRNLLAARQTKGAQRKVRDEAAAAFDAAAQDETRALAGVRKLSGIKDGQDLFFDVDGVRWHVELTGRRLDVRQANPEA